MPRKDSLKNSTKMVASIFLQAMDSAARAVDRGDAEAQHFLECLRDELAPQLKWAFRYGEWQLNAPPFVRDDEAPDTEPDFEFDEEG